MTNPIADAIFDSLRSEDMFTNGRTGANVVDALVGLSQAANRIAAAVTPIAVGRPDAHGGHVESLTEAAMGITGGLCRIAEAINTLADAVRESRNAP